MTITETVELENGLTLNISDASRKIAGDRWLASIVAKIEIPVDPKMLDLKLKGISTEDIREVIGDKAVFEKKMERNFIPEAEKHEAVLDMIQIFMADIVPYLSHEKFAEKFLEKKYMDERKRLSWYG